MRRFSAVLFDLDGTLLDTLADIASSMNFTLQQHGLQPYTLQEYPFLVGSGLREMVLAALHGQGRADDLADEIVEGFRAEYDRRWAENSRSYDGMVEALQRLHEAGVRLAVLSNKPDSFTQVMVRRLLPAELFDAVLGHREPFPIKPAPDSTLHILRQLGVSPERAALVGDSDVDILTARNAGIVPIGVDWGFRPREELIEAGARYMASSPSALASWLLG